MPTLTVKTKYINEIKEMGVYDKWLINTQMQWNKISNVSQMGFTERELSECKSVSDIINYSFRWIDTIEGFEFWDNICHTSESKRNI